MAKQIKTSAGEREVTMDRREPADRRDAPVPAPAAKERRKVQRRRQIDPTTCERDYSGDEIEFMQAMDDYKRRAGRMFPTCSEMLEVLRDIGYVRVSAEERAWLSQMPTAGDAASLTSSVADALVAE